MIFIDSIPQRFSGHEPDASIFQKNHDRWIHEFFEPSAFNMNSWYHPNFLGHSSLYVGPARKGAATELSEANRAYKWRY